MKTNDEIAEELGAGQPRRSARIPDDAIPLAMQRTPDSFTLADGVEICFKYPPNIGKIRQAGIPLQGREIFAWDGTIYNPSGGPVSSALISHEKVHFKQQDGDPEAWWEKYLADVDFRLEQEIESHRAEYKEFCKGVRQRETRVRYLSEIALRLAGPLYGGKITHREAMKRIR